MEVGLIPYENAILASARSGHDDLGDMSSICFGETMVPNIE